MPKNMGEKVFLWNCPKENRKVTLHKCASCNFCTDLTDLENGVYRTCIYQNPLIHESLCIDDFAQEDILF